MSNNRRVPVVFDMLNQFSEFIRVLIIVIKRIWPDICGIPAQKLIANDGVLLEETLRKAFMPEEVCLSWNQLRGCVNEASFKKLSEVGGFSIEGLHAQQIVDSVPFNLKEVNAHQGLSIATLKDLGLSSNTSLDFVFYRAEKVGLFACDLRNLREIIISCYMDSNIQDVLIMLSTVGIFRLTRKGKILLLSEYQENIHDGLKVISPDQKMIFMNLVH
jgi:hypothetical protein